MTNGIFVTRVKQTNFQSSDNHHLLQISVLLINVLYDLVLVHILSTFHSVKARIYE